MKTILDIGYGKEELLSMYHRGEISSRLFYGMIQLEDRYNIKHKSFSTCKGICGLISNNIRTIIPSDFVFMSYIYESSLILLALLKHLGICRKKIIVVSHNTLKCGHSSLERIILKIVYSAIDMFLFHSQKNLDESVEQNLIKTNQASFLYWGDDLKYIDGKFKISIDPFYISTGRENRDFKILINAFVDSETPLEIYTNRINYENNYDYLEDIKNKYPNILINYVSKDGETAHFLTQRTAECSCVVIPLLNNHVNYCVGLTSIVEAMALGKAVISSPNPYSPINLEELGIGIYAETIEEWKDAIKYLDKNPEKRKEMGLRARKIAEEFYNIDTTASKIDDILSNM